MAFQSPDFSQKSQKSGSRHTSLTWIDQYGNTQHANDLGEKNAFTQMQRNQRLRQDLSLYDANAMKYKDDLLRMFGQQTQYGIGQATGNVMAGVNQFLTRRGIDPRRSGIAASLQSQQLGNLQQQGAQAQLNFSSQLLQHMQNNRDAIVTGELTFFQALDRLNYNNELNKDLARFQQGLAKDSARWQALGSVLGLGGQVLGGLFGHGSNPDTSQLPGEMQTMEPVYP